MRKLILLFSLASFLMVLNACNSKDEASPKSDSPYAKLEGDWEVAGMTIAGEEVSSSRFCEKDFFANNGERYLLLDCNWISVTMKDSIADLVIDCSGYSERFNVSTNELNGKNYLFLSKGTTFSNPYIAFELEEETDTEFKAKLIHSSDTSARKAINAGYYFTYTRRTQ